MKSLTTKHRSGIFAAFACFFTFELMAASAIRSLPHVAGDELAVWQAMAEVIASENDSRPYKLWYYQSDFSSESFISSAIADPDREKFCGLSGKDVQAMISALKTVSATPVVLKDEIAESAGLKVAHKKNPRMRYFALSRVVFDPEGRRAWLSVELNGSRGSIVRLDKIEGRWSKTSRCGGWYIPE
jgi:hypothetical protein